jgi:hypothetical protein
VSVATTDGMTASTSAASVTVRAATKSTNLPRRVRQSRATDAWNGAGAVIVLIVSSSTAVLVVAYSGLSAATDRTGRIECQFDRTCVRIIAQVFDVCKARRAPPQIDTPFEHMFDPSATYR